MTHGSAIAVAAAFVATAVLWQPNPGPQYEFVGCPEGEVLYGGAKGGGKSDALLIAAVRDYQIGEMRSIIFRRSFPELKDLIRRSRQLYTALGGKYRSSQKEWLFPSGAIVEFAYLENDDDVERYQGRAFTFIGWDEIAQIGDESCYVTMLSCLRASADAIAKGLTLRCAATCNPIGAGRGWVKRRWRIPNNGAATKYYDRESDTWRVFIPSKISDNPYLANTNYSRRLHALPERLRRNLLEGRWDVVEGAMFAEFEEDRHVCKAFALPPNAKLWRGADDGFNAPACVLWFAEVDGRTYVIDELYRAGMTSEIMAEEVKRRDLRIPLNMGPTKAYNEKPLQGTIDASAFNEYDQGTPLGNGRGQRMNNMGCRWNPVAKGPHSRVAGWNLVHSRLEARLKDGRPQLIIFDRCKHLLEALPIVPSDKDDPEDIDKDFVDDHAIDALRYGLLHRRNAQGLVEVTGA